MYGLKPIVLISQFPRSSYFNLNGLCLKRKSNYHDQSNQYEKKKLTKLSEVVVDLSFRFNIISIKCCTIRKNEIIG